MSTQVTLKAAESLAGWILEDKDGDWGEAFDLCSDALPKLAKVLGATHPDTLDARSQLAQICWSATTKKIAPKGGSGGVRVVGACRGSIV